MRRTYLARCAAAAALAALAAAPAQTQEAAPPPPPSPGEIVAAAPAGDWVDIAPDDLLVMTLPPDAKGKPRTVYLQLIAAPFAQDWVSNIRSLARAHWYDGVAIVRVQDNYVVQWGDPAAEEKDAKALPAGLKVTQEADYTIDSSQGATGELTDLQLTLTAEAMDQAAGQMECAVPGDTADTAHSCPPRGDSYAEGTFNFAGWPVAYVGTSLWPVHCYGMVGVGRGMSPDAGTGAELYTVIGHAPRHLDRNIAVVGRIVEGIEHLSSLPRGTGSLGFYEDPAMRVPVVSVRLASDLPESEHPRFQYLSTDSATFATYADARANRRDPFFIVPAGGADICNILVPLRRRP